MSTYSPRHKAVVKAYQSKLRDRGLCIASAKHGRAHLGGRCEACWKRKQDAEKLKRDAERELRRQRKERTT